MEQKTSSSFRILFIVLFVLSLFANFCFFALLYSKPSLTSSDILDAYDKGYKEGQDDGYADGYATGKEEALRSGDDSSYNSGRDNAADEVSQTVDDETNYTPDELLLPTLIKPGTIVHNSKYLGTCPFTVELPDDDQLYYIYLEYVKPSLSSDFAMDQRELSAMSGAYISNLPNDPSGDDVSFITRAKSFDTIQVPPGVYRLWYCSGPYWYDIGNYFGDDTVWYTSDDLLSFYETYTDCIGNTITLYKVYDGNFSTYQTTDAPF